MIPGYRYRYPKYSHTEPITDTGFIPIFFIPIPIPGIGTWYRYLVSVPGIGIIPSIGQTLITSDLIEKMHCTKVINIVGG